MARLDTIHNPYQPPSATEPEVESTRSELAGIPKALASRTRRVVCGFGIYQCAWPLVVAYWMDYAFIDLVAYFITVNGLGIGRFSFRRFPWTALLCGIYPIALIVSMWHYGVLVAANWIPTHGSPVLALQLIASCWAVYAITLIVRCYLSHWRTNP